MEVPFHAKMSAVSAKQLVTLCGEMAATTFEQYLSSKVGK